MSNLIALICLLALVVLWLRHKWKKSTILTPEELKEKEEQELEAADKLLDSYNELAQSLRRYRVLTYLEGHEPIEDVYEDRIDYYPEAFGTVTFFTTDVDIKKIMTQKMIDGVFVDGSIFRISKVEMAEKTYPYETVPKLERNEKNKQRMLTYLRCSNFN